LREGHSNGVRPKRLLGRYRASNAVDDFENIRADTLGNLDRHGPLTVEPCKPARIFESASHGRDVAKGHRLHAVGLDRQGKQILEVLENTGHLDRESSAAGIERTGGDEPVIARHVVE